MKDKRFITIRKLKEIQDAQLKREVKDQRVSVSVCIYWYPNNST